MKTKDELINDAMKDLTGKLFPHLENWMRSRLDGVWNNGFSHGWNDAKEFFKIKEGENEKAYQTGFVDGQMDVRNKLEVVEEIKKGEYHKGYQDGQKAAWDVARRLYYFWFDVVFQDANRFADELQVDAKPGDSVFIKLFEQFTPDEVVQKLKAYAKKAKTPQINKGPKWKVGDCVIDCSGNRCLITNIDTHIHVLYENGKTHKWKKSDRFIKDGSTHVLNYVFDSEVWKHE